MPPRYAYWTILVDNQPTAFRAGALEELMPTFNRLKGKHPNAELKWFQNGKLWASRLDAREAMRERGQRGMAKDPRQSPRAHTGERSNRPKLEWRPKGESIEVKDRRAPKSRLDWTPKGAGRTKDWRPGGDHKDPRQKYKDAKKAKWTRFKQTIRARHDRRKKREDE